MELSFCLLCARTSAQVEVGHHGIFLDKTKEPFYFGEDGKRASNLGFDTRARGAAEEGGAAREIRLRCRLVSFLPANVGGRRRDGRDGEGEKEGGKGGEAEAAP